jgi:hypothetical protein
VKNIIFYTIHAVKQRLLINNNNNNFIFIRNESTIKNCYKKYTKKKYKKYWIKKGQFAHLRAFLKIVPWMLG